MCRSCDTEGEETEPGGFKRTCLWCGRTFLSKRKSTNFCSATCATYYERNGCSREEHMSSKNYFKTDDGRFASKCPWCGRIFVPRSTKSVFCCEKCQKAFSSHNCSQDEFARANDAEVLPSGLYRKTCRWCGKVFDTANIQMKNCSSACGKMLAKHGGKSRDEVMRTPRETFSRTCLWCGTAFTTTTPCKLYCTPYCTNMSRKHRGMNKAEYEAMKGSLVKVGNRRMKSPETRTCLWCGGTFETDKSRQTCCSAKCATSFGKFKRPKAEVLAEYRATELPDGTYEISCSECGAPVRSNHLMRRVCGECSTRKRKEAVRRILAAESAARKPRDPVSCGWCGKEFVPHSGRHTYCSEKCQKAFAHHGCTKAEWISRHGHEEVREGIYKRVCQWCGKEFETENPNQRNCRPICGKYLARSGGLSRAEWKADVERRKVRFCKCCGSEFTVQTTRRDFVALICTPCVRSLDRLREFTGDRTLHVRVVDGTEDVRFADGHTRDRKLAAYIATRTERLRKCRERYWQNHDAIIERQRRYRIEHHDEILARCRDRYNAERAAKIAAENARGNALAAQEEASIRATRDRFKDVEMVLLLPPEERWEFAKNWTEDERAYAASVMSSGFMDGGFGLVDDENALSVGDFNDGDL